MGPERRTRSFLDPQALGRLSRLPLFARRPMQGNVSGKHSSLHRGSSVEFAEYRKYVPGDDLRRLDWRMHGRSDRYFVKECEADTNLRCCLVVDTSGSMAFGSNGMSKIDYAKRLAGTLGYLAVMQGDAVYGGWTDLKEVPVNAIERLRHYFLTYKDAPGLAQRRTEITHIYGRNEAHDIIRRSQSDYQAHYGVVDDQLNTKLPA